MVSFKFWKWAPPIKVDDQVEYDGKFFKDGSFVLEFEVEVPEALWKVAVQKKTGKNPPPVVDVDQRILENIDLQPVRAIVDKIRKDIKQRTGRDVKLYISKVDSMKIRMVGKHQYRAKVVVSGAWSA